MSEVRSKEEWGIIEEKKFQVINLSRNLCPLTDVVNIQLDL